MSTESAEVKVKEKRFFIILGVIIGVILLGIITVISINRAGNDNPNVADVTLCDLDARGLCVVTFGVNKLDRMVINFQLPDADYPLFYVKASNRGIVNVYSCEVIEADVPGAYCAGIRTPLGESIDIEVYTTDGDTMMAHGTFIVSAIVLSTPINSDEAGSETETPTLESSFPDETESTPTPDGNTSNPQGR